MGLLIRLLVQIGHMTYLLNPRLKKIVLRLLTRFFTHVCVNFILADVI
jgi:hypothetical protein